MLYQQYRDGDGSFEHQIRSILDFSIHHATSKQSRDENKVSEFESFFADIEKDLSAQEKSVIDFYRDYQMERGVADSFATISDAGDEQQITGVMAACQPLLDARSTLGNADNDSELESNPNSSAHRQTLWSKLSDRFSSFGSLPVAALASVGLAVVALTLFLQTDAADPLVELTGVSTYESSIVAPLKDNLAPPTIDSMGFSPANSDSTVAYAVGSLFGELAISIAGDNKERVLQTLKRMDLISRSAPDYGNHAGSDGMASLAKMSDVLLRTQESVTNSTAPNLLDDKVVREELEEILIAFNDASKPEELTAFQKLGSWTLVTLTLAESDIVETNNSKRMELVDRLMTDAEPIFHDVQKQVGLSDAQRNAIADFGKFIESWRSGESQSDSLSALRDITKTIDTTFRI